VRQQPETVAPRTRVEYWLAFAVLGLALAINPLTIRLLMRGTGIGVRPLTLSLVLDLFLVAFAGALLARGKLRGFFFLLFVLALPLVALAGLEVIASKIHLSQRVAVFEDLSVIKRGNGWEVAAIQHAPEKDGFAVYRPWSGKSATINEVGLRTSPPTPKAQREYRIAVVGSSETFGSRLAEADTIPALLQTALHRNGRDRISVYNFGIEGANISRDLALVRHFKDIYGIDRVIFIVGGAETWAAYSDIERPDLVNFELQKAMRWIMATWFEPSPARLAQFDAQYQALSPDKKRRLVDGIKAANDYCRSASLRCDFILQPQLGSRRPLVGTEVQLAQTARRLCPRCEALTAQMYRDALNLGIGSQVHDFTTVFDNRSEQFYFDVGHVNEAGSAIIANSLAPIVMQTAPAN
jgi:hypothetical protein